MKVLIIFAALVAAALCAAPAPPPGWTPSGRLLLVPARLEYPPPAEAPAPTDKPSNGTRVAQESESDESQSEKLLESGEYYVLLPDGRLQMVKYATAALKTSEEEPSDSKEPQGDQSAPSGEGYNYNQPQQQFQPAAYYVQAQEEPKESQNAQYNAEGPRKFQQNQFQPAYYVQAEEQKENQNAKFQQQRFQPAAYPVFIRPQPDQSAQYKSENYPAQYPAYQKPSESKFQQVKQEPNYQIELVQFPLQGSEQFSQTKLQLTEQKSEQNKEQKEEESGFEANLQYRDVKPISAPIYAYNPTPLVRILKK